MKVLKNYPPYLTQGYKESHKANDIVGRHPNQYNVLDTIVAMADGKVERTIDNCNINTNGKNWNTYDPNNPGNIVIIDHGNGYKTRYYHLQYKSVKVKAGDYVKAGQPIGEMGNTGHSFGGHLHLEVRLNGVQVDPYDYVFKNKEFATLPTPVERDITTKQIEVVADQLRCRTGHSINDTIIGFIPKGIYNILYEYKDDKYIWYEVETGKWIANDGNWCKVLEPENKPVEPEKEEDNTNTPETDTNDNETPILDEIEDYYDKKEKQNAFLWLIEAIVNFIFKLFKK